MIASLSYFYLWQNRWDENCVFLFTFGEYAKYSVCQ